MVNALGSAIPLHCVVAIPRKCNRHRMRNTKSPYFANCLARQSNLDPNGREPTAHRGQIDRSTITISSTRSSPSDGNARCLPSPADNLESMLHSPRTVACAAKLWVRSPKIAKKCVPKHKNRPDAPPSPRRALPGTINLSFSMGRRLFHSPVR